MDIYQIVNHPVPSSTYIVVDNGKALIIDPGSKYSSDLISKIQNLNVKVDYIILTHEHFDHIWGVNEVRQKCNCKVIASEICANKIKIPQNYYNLLYFGDAKKYSIDKVDLIVEDGCNIEWMNHQLRFFLTPGHSSSSMCFSIDNFLFSGDTIMKGYKPLILKRHEGSKEQFRESIRKLVNIFPPNTVIYPGHGEKFELSVVIDEILSY